MIDPIGNVVVDPVVRLRDKSLVIQHPERERIADEIERLRDRVMRLGDMADCCVYDDLKVVCTYCRCSKGPSRAALNIHKHGSE